MHLCVTWPGSRETQPVQNEFGWIVLKQTKQKAPLIWGYFLPIGSIYGIFTVIYPHLPYKLAYIFSITGSVYNHPMVHIDFAHELPRISEKMGYQYLPFSLNGTGEISTKLSVLVSLSQWTLR